MLYGPPAVGKRTLAIELQRRLPFVLVENQHSVQLAREFFEAGTKPFFELSSALRQTVLEHLAHCSDAPGVILTYCYWGKSAPFLAFVRRHFALFAVRLHCPLDALHQRVCSAERAGLGKIASVAELEALRVGENLAAIVPGTLLDVEMSATPPSLSADRISNVVQQRMSQASPQ